MPAATVVVIIGFLAGLLTVWFLLRQRVERWADSWLESWWGAEADDIRRQTVQRSEAVLRGRISEQLAPLRPEFVYDPADARFIGTPVDFVVFDGWAELHEGKRDSLRSIVFLDVKTGGSTLTTVQRRVRECVQRGSVGLEVWRHEMAGG